MHKTLKALPVALLLAGLLGACSDSGSDNADATTITTEESTTTTTVDLDGELDVEDFLDQLRDFEIDGPIEAMVTAENQDETIERTFSYLEEDKYALWSDDFRASFDKENDLAMLCAEASDECVTYEYESANPEVEQARTGALIFTAVGIAELLEAEYEGSDAELTVERETRAEGDFDDAVCYIISEVGQEDGEICIDPNTGLSVLFDSGTGIVFTVESVSDQVEDEETPFESIRGRADTRLNEAGNSLG
jgi:hypothetical protein